jgi:hypothetical protein
MAMSHVAGLAFRLFASAIQSLVQGASPEIRSYPTGSIERVKQWLTVEKQMGGCLPVTESALLSSSLLLCR